MKPVSRQIELFINILTLLLLIVTVRVIVLHLQKPVPPDGRAVTHGTGTVLQGTADTSTADDHRIARKFIADTLPGLMRAGLIRSYQRRSAGTLITVAGRIWKVQTRFFKESLLRELIVFNRVSGYAARTQVKDSVSGNLYAEVSAESTMTLYD